MKVLAIDTTGKVASVSVVDECAIIGEITTNFERNHSVMLMPMVDNLLKMLSLNINLIDYIACANGPGSFTGLRIGAATAKALAHGADKKIVPVPTLDALAYNIYDATKVIVPVIDARRNQVYTAFYKWQNNTVVRITDYFIDDILNVISQASHYKDKALFTGDGVLNFQTILKSYSHVSIAPSYMNMQRAAAVGALAIQMIKNDNFQNYDEFAAFYLQKAQAEKEYENSHAIK